MKLARMRHPLFLFLAALAVAFSVGCAHGQCAEKRMVIVNVTQCVVTTPEACMMTRQVPVAQEKCVRWDCDEGYAPGEGGKCVERKDKPPNSSHP
jgi:hypothetical protein